MQYLETGDYADHWAVEPALFWFLWIWLGVSALACVCTVLVQMCAPSSSHYHVPHTPSYHHTMPHAHPHDPQHHLYPPMPLPARTRAVTFADDCKL